MFMVKTMYKSHTSRHLYRIYLFSICETAGMESCWLKFVAKFVSPEYYILGDISTSMENFFHRDFYTSLKQTVHSSNFENKLLPSQ